MEYIVVFGTKVGASENLENLTYFDALKQNFAIGIIYLQ